MPRPTRVSRPTRRAGLVVTATATLTAALSALPSFAGAAPTAPAFGPTIDALASYAGQTTCDPTSKPGTLALRSLLENAYPSTGDLGIVRACDIGGTSEHKEGRAWDWAIDVNNPTQEQAAQDFFTWAFAPDAYGNKYAMARRLGIMYMIHNRKIWSSYNASAGWRPYTGPNPHVDHVHISLSWAGAKKTTTYWSPSASAAPTSTSTPSSAPSTAPSAVDPITAHWTALGGSAKLGVARGPQYSVPGGGKAQDFSHGRILWSSATGAHLVVGGILARYDAFGGPAALGLPTSDEVGVAGGRANSFQRGNVYWSSGTRSHVVVGAILARYLTMGGAAGLGLPTTDEVPAGTGRSSSFQHGRIFWSHATGTHSVIGGILAKYDAVGGVAALGLPTDDEVAAGAGRSSSFQHGRVFWSHATGSHSVVGGILAKFDAVGGVSSLGLPTTDEVDVPGGRSSAFTLGRIYWSRHTGAHVVRGAILKRYLVEDGPAGPLGLPVADQTPVRALLSSDFQDGRIIYDPTSGRTWLR